MSVRKQRRVGERENCHQNSLIQNEQSNKKLAVLLSPASRGIENVGVNRWRFQMAWVAIGDRAQQG